MKILIKSHVPDLILPEKIEKGDWVDLRAAEDVFIPWGEMKLVSLGISTKLPAGCEAHIVARSSTFKNFGIILSNSIGIIDNSYCGDGDIWQLPALCLCRKQDGGTLIRKNDRVCQFRVVRKQNDLKFEQVEFLLDDNRGGFGSTGIQ